MMLDEGNNIMYGHYQLRRLLEGTTTLADLEGDREEQEEDDDNDSQQLLHEDITLRDALNNVKRIIDQQIQGLNRAAKQALDTEKGGSIRALSANTRTCLQREQYKSSIDNKLEEMITNNAFHPLDTDNDQYLRAAAAVAREKLGVNSKIFQELQHYCHVRDRCHEDAILHEKLREHVKRFQSKEEPYQDRKAREEWFILTPAGEQQSMRDTLQNLVTELQVRICDLLRDSDGTNAHKINEGRQLMHLAQAWLVREEGEISNLVVGNDLSEASLIGEKQVYQMQSRRMKEISALLQHAEELLQEFWADTVPADDSGEEEDEMMMEG